MKEEIKSFKLDEYYLKKLELLKKHFKTKSNSEVFRRVLHEYKIKEENPLSAGETQVRTR